MDSMEVSAILFQFFASQLIMAKSKIIFLFTHFVWRCLISCSYIILLVRQLFISVYQTTTTLSNLVFLVRIVHLFMGIYGIKWQVSNEIAQQTDSSF